MAALQCLIGFEMGSSAYEAGLSAGASIQSGFARSGTYALRCLGTGLVAANATLNFDNGGDDSYVRFYFYAAVLPPSTSPVTMARFGQSGDIQYLRLEIASTGIITVYDDEAIVRGVTSTPIQAGVWYRIELSMLAASFELRINGHPEVIGSVGGNLTQFQLGNSVGLTTNFDFYYDDVCAADDQFPGEGRVLRLKANADGTDTAYTIGAGAGAKWEQLDEDAPDASDYLLSTLVIGEAYTAAMQNSATVGISGSIFGVKMLLFIQSNTGEGGAYGVRFRGNGEDNYGVSGDAFSIGPGVKQHDFHYRRDMSEVDWTTTTLDALEMGLIEESATIRHRFVACYAMADYRAAVTVPNAGSAGPAAQVI